jgi:hypothetical protein
LAIGDSVGRVCRGGWGAGDSANRRTARCGNMESE